VRFRGRGFGRLAELTDRLEKKHVRLNRLALDTEDREENTIRLTLMLPAGVSRGDLLRETSDIADVEILD
jgi:hypothetical protein